MLAATLAILCSLGAAVASDSDSSYRLSVEKWRAQREANLKADGGWLTVAGLFWLHEGDNRFGADPLNDIVLPAASAPADAGNFEFHGGKVTLHVNPGVPVIFQGKRIDTAPLRADSDPSFDQKTDQVTLGGLTLYIHASGSRLAVRLIDKNSKIRKRFVGLRWFPVDPSYRVVAQYTPYPSPKSIQVQNIMGDFDTTTVPGYVSFTLHGQELRLDVEDDATEFSITFRDLTSGKETYGAARFLVTDLPKDGKVVLDFNEAYNPPCAFNPYTTCPLPTPQNRLRARIAAGEMTYLGPH